MRRYTETRLFIFIIFITCLSLNNSTVAQSQQLEDVAFECGSEPTFSNIETLSGHQNGIADYQLDYDRMTFNQVPVSIHVVSNDNGIGGLSIDQVTDILANANATFASANIELVQCSPIDFINETQYFYYAQSEETSMSEAYNVAGTLNIYFVGTLQSTSGSYICGYTYFPQSNKDLLIATNSCATSGSTMVHELGHYFGLYHTHGNSNGGNTDELNDGSNCIFGGDDICDTPADPYLNGVVNVDCEYIGNTVDSNGTPFDPDTDNIMSYAPSNCRVSFSDGQLQRMAYINQIEKGHLNCDGLTAEFMASHTVGHCGQSMSVNFTYTGENAISWDWDIDNDGTIDYTSQNPSHIYTEDGEYEVSLKVSNGSISLSKTFPILIKRLSTHTGSFNDDFSNALENWGIEDEDMINRWDKISNYQYSDNAIMCINNYTDSQVGELDYLTSKNIDLTSIVNPILEFKLSYQPKSSTWSDILKVEISSDCGLNYDVIYEKTGMDLSTTGSTGFEKWFPQTENDWKWESISLAEYDTEVVHIRFVNESNKSNYLYIDAVNIIEGVALPVEWESVSVKEDIGGAIVDWSVNDMSNHSHFEVERSIDGSSFEKIGAITSISETGNYKWLDAYAKNRLNYYRIKQLDLDGRIDYSKIVSLNYFKRAEAVVFPTLAKDKLSIYVDLNNKTHIQYTIISVDGKISRKGILENEEFINIAALQNGVYWIKIEANGIFETERFIKM